MPDATAKYALVLSLGPEEREVPRVRDLLEGVFAYEPERTACVVMIDDDFRNDRRLAEQFTVPETCKLVVLPNPRRGKGDGWSSGLAAGMITAYHWLAQHAPEIDFALKVDSDTLIVAPFAQQVAAAFAANPNVGQMGSYRMNPDGPKGNTETTRAWEKLLRQFTIWRRTTTPWPRVQIGYLGRYGRIRRIIRRAILNGYALGEYCQGGGYALSMDAIRKIEAAGYFDDPLLFFYAPCGEDVVISLFVRAVGLQLMDLNRDGEPFGVKYLGLADTPQRLLERGYSIIHSVKDYRQYREAETRAFFKAQREKRSLAQADLSARGG